VGSVGDSIEESLAEPSVWDHLGPFGKRQVGGYDDGSLFRPFSDDLEEELGAEVCHGHVAYLVDGDQVVAIPAGKHATQLQLLLGLDQFVDQGGCCGEAHSALLTTGSHTEPGQQMRLASAAVTDQDYWFSTFDISALGQFTDLRGTDLGSLGEVELIQSLGPWQVCNCASSHACSLSITGRLRS